MSMNVRLLRRCLWVAAAGVTALAVAVWVFGPERLGPPDRTPEALAVGADASEASANASAVPRAGVPRLADFTGLTDRRLRAPLYDAPPEVRVVEPPPPPPPLTLRLVGTVLDGAHSQAFLMTSSGQVEMHGVDAVVDGARITAIGEAEVAVVHHDRPVTLTIEDAAAAGGAAQRRSRRFP